jgi:hypothetical protein
MLNSGKRMIDGASPGGAPICASRSRTALRISRDRTVAVGWKGAGVVSSTCGWQNHMRADVPRGQRRPCSRTISMSIYVVGVAIIHRDVLESITLRMNWRRVFWSANAVLETGIVLAVAKGPRSHGCLRHRLAQRKNSPLTAPAHLVGNTSARLWLENPSYGHEQRFRASGIASVRECAVVNCLIPIPVAGGFLVQSIE